MTDTGAELRRRKELAFAAFTFVLAVAVGCVVVRAAFRFGHLWGSSSTAAAFQALLLGDCLAAAAALSAIVHRDVSGAGRAFTRRLALIAAVAYLGFVLRLLLWVFPMARAGM